jgi:hypothetical protein
MNERGMQARTSALIEASRVVDQPSWQDCERVRARITAALAGTVPPVASGHGTDAAAHGGGSSAAGVSSGSAAGAAHVALAALAGKALLVLLLGASVTTAVISYWHASERRTHTTTHAGSERAPRVSKAQLVLAPVPAAEHANPNPSLAAASAAEPAAMSGTASAPPSVGRADQRLPHRARAFKPEAREATAPPSSVLLAVPTLDVSPKVVLPAAAGGVAQAGLGGELALLSAAQRALAVSDLGRALALLDQHASHYPEGRLTQERLAARAATLCRMGRSADGAQELAHLRARAPQSPLLSWASGYCRHDLPH